MQTASQRRYLALRMAPPCEIHTVYVRRILQGGVRVGIEAPLPVRYTTHRVDMAYLTGGREGCGYLPAGIPRGGYVNSCLGCSLDPAGKRLQCR